MHKFPMRSCTQREHGRSLSHLARALRHAAHDELRACKDRQPSSELPTYATKLHQAATIASPAQAGRFWVLGSFTHLIDAGGSLIAFDAPRTRTLVVTLEPVLTAPHAGLPCPPRFIRDGGPQAIKRVLYHAALSVCNISHG